MDDKKKKSGLGMGTITFSALWTLLYGLGWGTLIAGGILVDNIFPTVMNRLPIIALFAFVGLVPGFISSVGQQWLIKHKMNIKIPFWWLWSTIAWTLAGMALRLLEYWPFTWFVPDERLGISMVFSALFLPPAIIQAWLLRKHISRSWMWAIAAIVSSTTFAIPLLASSMINEFQALMAFGAAGLMQGAVMGLSLLWLFGMTSSEKSKKQLAEQEQRKSDQHLLRRLEAIDNEIEEENLVDAEVIAWDRARN